MTGYTRVPSRHRTELPSHEYVVGQLVRMKGGLGVASTTAQTFRITAKLPARDGSLQYRMRSDQESHERVTTENNLDPIDVAAVLIGSPVRQH